MDQLGQVLTELLLGSGPLPKDVTNPPRPIEPLRVGTKKHYVLCRTMQVLAREIESAGLDLEEVIVKGQVYRVSRAVIGNSQQGPIRILTAHTPAEDGWSRCTMIATRRAPWTPEVAGTALAHTFGGIEGIKDSLWHPAKVTRITEDGKPGMLELMDGTSMDTDTFTFVGHVVSGARAGSRMELLESILADYPWLVNASLLVDPSKFKKMRQTFHYVPDNWTNGIFVVQAYMLNNDLVRDMQKLASGPAPKDLASDTVAEWIREIVTARCNFHWPHREFVHDLVDHFADWLRGSKARPAPVVVQDSAPDHTAQDLIETLRKELAEAHARQKSETDRADGLWLKLRTCEGQLARCEADVKLARAENKDLHTQMKELKAQNAELLTRSQEVSQELSHLAIERFEATQATARLRAPHRWEELVECAKPLKHVSLTAEAVQPALRNLARGGNSKMLLKSTWRALRALEAWMSVPTGERGAFDVFLEKHPQEGMPPGRVAGGESALTATNPAMRNARTFRTAQGVAMEMFAHVKLSNMTGAQARMHYATDGDRVHVGYIGPHLHNILATRAQ